MISKHPHPSSFLFGIMHYPETACPTYSHPPLQATPAFVQTLRQAGGESTSSQVQDAFKHQQGCLPDPATHRTWLHSAFWWHTLSALSACVRLVDRCISTLGLIGSDRRRAASARRGVGAASASRQRRCSADSSARSCAHQQHAGGEDVEAPQATRQP